MSRSTGESTRSPRRQLATNERSGTRTSATASTRRGRNRRRSANRPQIGASHGIHSPVQYRQWTSDHRLLLYRSALRENKTVLSVCFRVMGPTELLGPEIE